MKEKLTPMEYLKNYLGVVDGEEFDVYDGDVLLKYSPYHFSENGLYDKDNDTVNAILACLTNGRYTIKKKPFVPKFGEIYYFIEKNNGNIIKALNIQWFDDLARIKCGWTFRTYEEAEANKERVMREMKEVMNND